MSEYDEPRPDWFRLIVVGVAVAATLAYAGWLGTTILSVRDDFNPVKDRLTRIEVTIVENRAERQAQIDDLRTRVNRLEDRLEMTRVRQGGGE